MNEQVSSTTAFGITTNVNSSATNTDFAANGIAGVDYSVMPQLTVGARYRVLYINTATSSSGSGGLFGSNGDFIGHMFTANATWHF